MSMSPSLNFSIVTPSFNSIAYLKRCCASVADQKGVSVEHIVVDGASTDGTVDWIKSLPGMCFLSEPDHGMYDAVNKGLRLAKGDVLAYLNCDEQYLPDTLQFVDQYFVAHPEVDVVFGDALLIRADGSLLAFRKGYKPVWWFIEAGHLYVLSCTMFFRRRLIERGFFFNADLRDVADADFVVRVLRGGAHGRHLRRYLAAFTVTGKNMSAGPNALLERKALLASAPRWIRGLRGPINGLRLMTKLVSGAYFERAPIRYEVYADERAGGRQEFVAESVSWRWPA
jgi:glycosyltransferase involved in cell wall biosynthesis